jgi:hypothetical protein
MKSLQTIAFKGIIIYATNNAEYSGFFPGATNSNLLIVPEEKNVLIKSVSINITNNFNPLLFANKQWQFNYTFFDKMQSQLATIPGKIDNPTSGSWTTTPQSSLRFSSVNSMYPVNNYQEGILAGGIRLHYLGLYKYNTDPAGDQTEINISINYQEID